MHANPCFTEPTSKFYAVFTHAQFTACFLWNSHYTSSAKAIIIAFPSLACRHCSSCCFNASLALHKVHSSHASLMLSCSLDALALLASCAKQTLQPVMLVTVARDLVKRASLACKLLMHPEEGSSVPAPLGQVLLLFNAALRNISEPVRLEVFQHVALRLTNPLNTQSYGSLRGKSERESVHCSVLHSRVSDSV
jgi:hypothetical protein